MRTRSRRHPATARVGHPRLRPHCCLPSPGPSKALCVGLNYDDHVTGSNRDLPTYPVSFPRYAASLSAPTEPMRIPPESEQVD